MTPGRTPLELQLINELQTSGPITFRDYMHRALYDPHYGYYKTPPVKIGAKGDFYTASNVHGVFGAVLARVIAKLIETGDSDRSDPITVAEIGGGTGQLAHDILSTLESELPALFARLEYIIVETSPTMVASQRELLRGFEK